MNNEKEYYRTATLELLKTDLDIIKKITEKEDERYGLKEWRLALIELEGVKLDLEMAIQFLEGIA